MGPRPTQGMDKCNRSVTAHVSLTILWSDLTSMAIVHQLQDGWQWGDKQTRQACVCACSIPDDIAHQS
jgi:hypothetical protein